MTTPVVGNRKDEQSGSTEKRERGAGWRALLFTATALVAGATGVAGTLLQQSLTAPDTSGVDAQAAKIAEHLRGDLHAGFYSGGGQTYGGQFTEGTIVAQVAEHGGVLLSSDTERTQADGVLHTAEVMLGLTPPARETVAAEAYPVHCYRYTFGVGSSTVKQSGMPCPASRTDGRPGSLAAQMGALLTQQRISASVTTAGYAHSARGAVDFLKDKGLTVTGDKVSAISGGATGDDVYAVALRINGTCHYLRMDPSPTASDLTPLWPAPADEQTPCDTRQATSAATLYGIDPAKPG
ncbi:hypothetical protein ACIGN6_12310 [Streptomyces sp. NPDC053792]|uniref:hypothetical protein n=1 Tax=Streptomyces sp. NPDC053792 TaxID=3365716 RepID=UPI0037D54A2D